MKLVIFDCDGVLVDSEILADRVLLEYCRECFPGQDFSAWEGRMTGLKTREILARMELEHAIRFAVDAAATILERLDARIHAEIEPIQGIGAALAAITQLKAVVSNSDSRHVRRLLGHTGLLEHFHERIFGADQVERPKPHPDLYLLASERLGVQPRECVVIEDSVPGVTAAVAAGARVIGFVGGSHSGWRYAEALRAAGATEIIDVMQRLPAVLSALSSASQR